jgi:hypothetical protein
MSDVIQFPSPVSTQCTASTMPAMDTAEHRRRAVLNFYSAERRAGVDPVTASERADEFERRLDCVAREMGMQQ